MTTHLLSAKQMPLHRSHVLYMDM